MSHLVLAPTAMPHGGAADYSRTYRQVIVPATATVEDVLRPSFWANHVALLQKNDLIDILSEDGGLDMQVRVVGKGIGMVHLRTIRMWTRDEVVSRTSEAAASDDEVPAGYVVSFAPKQLWRVATKNPSEIISKDHPSKSAAIEAAFNHARLANGIAA